MYMPIYHRYDSNKQTRTPTHFRCLLALEKMGNKGLGIVESAILLVRSRVTKTLNPKP